MMELRVGIYIYICISIKMDKNRVGCVGDGLFLTGEYRTGGLGRGGHEVLYIIGLASRAQASFP